MGSGGGVGEKGRGDNGVFDRMVEPFNPAEEEREERERRLRGATKPGRASGLDRVRVGGNGKAGSKYQGLGLELVSSPRALRHQEQADARGK